MPISHRRLRTVGAAAAAIGLLASLATPLSASADTTFSITASYSDPGSALDKSALLNSSQGGYGLIRNLNVIPQRAAHLAQLGARQIRLDHIFDDDFYGVVTRSSAGQLQYNFSKLDSVVLPLVGEGIRPFFSLSYMPSAMGPIKYGPPNSNAEWGQLVTATVNHYASLGLTGLNWELWNEPDGSGFWKGTVPQYNAMYGVTAAAVRAADPTAKVGAPGLESPTPAFLGTFLDYVAANPGTALDFVSVHRYSGVTDFSFVASVQSAITSRGLPVTPVYVDEWNQTSAFGTTPGGIADTQRDASYAARRLSTAITQPTLAGVFFFSPIEGWNVTADFSSDLGQETIDGHRKAVGNVFEAYNLLGATRLPAATTGLPADNSVGTLVTKDADRSRLALLAWNDTSTAANAALSLTSLPYATRDFSVTRYDISATAGNYYADWSAGVRNQVPGPRELLVPSARAVLAPATTWSSAPSLPANSVSLFVLEPSTDPVGAVTLSPAPTITNVARTTTTTASSSYESPVEGWGTARVVDGRTNSIATSDRGNPSMGWTSDAHPGPVATEWVQSDFGATKSFDTVTLWPRSDQTGAGASFPTDFTIAGSADGSTWTELARRTGYSLGSAVRGPQTFEVATASYRYLRVTAQRLGRPVLEGATPVYRFQLAELEVTRAGAKNSGFESGALGPWTATRAATVTSSGRLDGRYAATFTGAGRGVQQVITGLTPNTTYRFGGWLKSGVAGDRVFLGAKDFGGTEVSTPVDAPWYRYAWVSFTTGPSSTSAVIYAYKNSGSAQAWFDSAVLTAN